MLWQTLQDLVSSVYLNREVIRPGVSCVQLEDSLSSKCNNIIATKIFNIQCQSADQIALHSAVHSAQFQSFALQCILHSFNALHHSALCTVSMLCTTVHSAQFQCFAPQCTMQFQCLAPQCTLQGFNALHHSALCSLLCTILSFANTM